MDGLQWKSLLNWMIWGYPYFWKHPCIARSFLQHKTQTIKQPLRLLHSCGTWKATNKNPKDDHWKIPITSSMRVLYTSSKYGHFFHFFRGKKKWCYLFSEEAVNSFVFDTNTLEDVWILAWPSDPPSHLSGCPPSMPWTIHVVVKHKKSPKIMFQCGKCSSWKVLEIQLRFLQLIWVECVSQ